jgi:hypothetical protein
MMVEKVPDSTYEMVGGLDKQIKEIKEVRKYLIYLLLADSRHRTVHPFFPSRIRLFYMPDPGSASKNLSILNPKFVSKLS